MKSKLIVIEGACDGIGKSTQFALLKEKLTEMGKNVVTHHFPSYGTKRAALVESYLKGERIPKRAPTKSMRTSVKRGPRLVKIWWISSEAA